MEDYIYNLEELKYLWSYDIWRKMHSDSTEKLIYENVYFLGFRGNYGLFLNKEYFLNKREKVELMKSVEGLKCCFRVKKKDFNLVSSYYILELEKHNIKFTESYIKLKEMPREICLDKPEYARYVLLDDRTTCNIRPRDFERRSTVLAFVPCYSYFQFEPISDNKLFASTFQTEDKKFKPFELKFRSPYAKTNNFELNIEIKDYFQAEYNLAKDEQNNRLDFIGVNKIQAQFVFELVSGYRNLLKDYFRGNSLLFSVESKLVITQEEYRYLSFKLFEARVKPKFVLLHVTKINPQAEGKKIEFSSFKRKVDFPYEFNLKEQSSAHKSNRKNQTSNLFSNCSYLFEYDQEFSASTLYTNCKPCLLTVIYLFEEDKKMVTKEQLNFVLNLGKAKKLGRRATEILIEMVIG